MKNISSCKIGTKKYFNTLIVNIGSNTLHLDFTSIIWQLFLNIEMNV